MQQGGLTGVQPAGGMGEVSPKPIWKLKKVS